MKNSTIYLALLLGFFVHKMSGQETFEQRAKNIASRIEKSTKEEKNELKIEIEGVNNQLVIGIITKEEAENKKKILAEARAINIESRVAMEQEALNNLVQEQVDGKIKEQDSVKRNSLFFCGYKIIDGDKIKIPSERRTTSQFVFALGLNNLLTNDNIKDSDYKIIGSHFYELGVTYNSRLFKTNNLLHAKYGLSLMYNNLRPTKNRSFFVNDNQTNLEENANYLKDSRFRNVSLVAPIHLEFDFSGNKTTHGKAHFQTHQNFRLGLGGYAGLRLKSKQILIYGNDLGVKERTRGDFNASNFIYGMSAYLGYKETSLYLKYDLNPLFKDNVIPQNNISLGIRFDLH
jgi:hypothetical protein